MFCIFGKVSWHKHSYQNSRAYFIMKDIGIYTLWKLSGLWGGLSSLDGLDASGPHLKTQPPYTNDVVKFETKHNDRPGCACIHTSTLLSWIIWRNWIWDFSFDIMYDLLSCQTKIYDLLSYQNLQMLMNIWSQVQSPIIKSDN